MYFWMHFLVIFKNKYLNFVHQYYWYNYIIHQHLNFKNFMNTIEYYFSIFSSNLMRRQIGFYINIFINQLLFVSYACVL